MPYQHKLPNPTLNIQTQSTFQFLSFFSHIFHNSYSPFYPNQLIHQIIVLSSVTCLKNNHIIYLWLIERLMCSSGDIGIWELKGCFKKIKFADFLFRHISDNQIISNRILSLFLFQSLQWESPNKQFLFVLQSNNSSTIPYLLCKLSSLNLNLLHFSFSTYFLFNIYNQNLALSIITMDQISVQSEKVDNSTASS